METATTYRAKETAINDKSHHLDAAYNCFKNHGLDALSDSEKIALAAMLTRGIEAPLPSDVTAIAKTANQIMMDLFSLESMLRCVFEAMPDFGDGLSCDARETVRLAANLINQFSEKLELEVVFPLDKLAGR